MIERTEFLEKLFETASGSAMPKWQLKLFVQLLDHADKGKRLTIMHPRICLPPITIDRKRPGRIAKGQPLRNPRPRQGSLPL